MTAVSSWAMNRAWESARHADHRTGSGNFSRSRHDM